MSTFFLTSGRSGSTALARLLHTHPDIAVVSDLFEPAVDEPYFAHSPKLTGDEFWELLTRPSIAERIAHWRERPTDELLFLPTNDHDVSLLMSYTLPFISEDPWELRVQLEPQIRHANPAAAPHHLEQFFELVRRFCRARVWVERTGGSLPHAAKMIDAWPDARFIFLLRDPIETALSMRTGSFFRLYLAMQSGEQSCWKDERFRDPARLGAMLDRWTVDAATAIDRLPATQLHTLTYEQFVADPHKVLLGLLAFARPGDITAADRSWALEQAMEVVAAPIRSRELAPRPLADLREACAGAHAIWMQATNATWAS